MFQLAPHPVRPIVAARKAVLPEEPRTSRVLLSVLGVAAPVYNRFALKLRSLSMIGSERAVSAYEDFQKGKSRLIVAFRHAYGDEPQLTAQTLLSVLPREAKRLGRELPRPTHAHFVHGYEVPLWGGAAIRWLLPRFGAVPVHHAKLDSPSLKRIRGLMTSGSYPLALAPEGQTSYASRSVPRLERGFAHIALWALADLQALGRNETVTVLPLSFHYRYGKEGAKALDRVLSGIESVLGDSAPGVPSAKAAGPVDRLRRAAEALLRSAEGYYEAFHREDHRRAEPIPLGFPAAAGGLNERWARVVDAALRAGEGALGLKAEGDAIERTYRIRHACWDRIYGKTEEATPLKAALDDRTAGEAWFAMRHMELADLGFYLDFDGISADYGTDFLIEGALNFLDAASRLMGGNFSARPVAARRDAVVVAGEPVDMGALASEHGGDRRATAEAALAALNDRYRHCVEEYDRRFPNGNR